MAVESLALLGRFDTGVRFPAVQLVLWLLTGLWVAHRVRLFWSSVHTITGVVGDDSLRDARVSTLITGDLKGR